METFIKFFTGTTGVILAIVLCVLCFLLAVGLFCVISGGTIISVVPTVTPKPHTEYRSVHRPHLKNPFNRDHCSPRKKVGIVSRYPTFRRRASGAEERSSSLRGGTP